MSSMFSSVMTITSVLKDPRRRFFTRYAEVNEGVLAISGERVLLCSLRVAVSREFDEDDMWQRLRFMIKSGIRLGRVIDYGVDGSMTPYIITEWRKLEPVTLAVRHQGSPSDVVWQIAAQIEKLHRGGMPFGDISEETFLIDPTGRVFICGIPAYGLPLPLDANTEKIEDYLAPEHSDRAGIRNDDTDLFAQDIYALGVCAHELFARKAFPRPNSLEQLEEYLARQTPNLLTLYHTVPPWTMSLISRCITWEPEERANIFEIREIARQGTTMQMQLSRLIADIKDIPLPHVYWRSMLNPTYRQLTASALFAFSAMIIVYFAASMFHQWRPDDLHVDMAQAYDNVDSAFNSGAFSDGPERRPRHNQGPARLPFQSGPDEVVNRRTPGTAEGGHEGAPEGTEGKNYEFPVGTKVVLLEGQKAEAANVPLQAKPPVQPKELPRSSDFERFVGTQTAQPGGKSRLWATPEKELVSLITRPPGLPRSQFYTVGTELLSRNRLSTAPKLALLALLHLDPSLLPTQTARALLQVIDGSIQSAQVVELGPLMVEDVDYVLAALMAHSPFPSTALQAYQVLASRPVQSESMRAVLAQAKLNGWAHSFGNLKAIGMLALGSFASDGEKIEAFYSLLDRDHPMDVLLFGGETALARRDAPWCPIIEL